MVEYNQSIKRLEKHGLDWIGGQRRIQIIRSENKVFQISGRDFIENF
jgi:hypothetical protein